MIGFSTTRVSADDWLAVLPECSMPDAARAELSLFYPSLELPAVVQPGSALVARVRTPAALTPPPGVQQESALTNFLGLLSAPASRVGVAASVQHRHTLPVLSVRPDGASSLVYRVRLQLPAYLAEGTYTFSLRTPFGTREAVSAVRVVRAKPRVSRLPAGVFAAPATAASWPVDIWLSDSAAPQQRTAAIAALREWALLAELPQLASAPTLPRDGPALALRVGGELWVRGGCSDARAFERELASLLAVEGLRRVPLQRALDALPPPPSAAELARLPELVLGAGGAHLDNRASASASELSLLLPFASALRSEGGTLELFPASDPSARTPRAKLARWRVPAGERASLTLTTAPTGRELELDASGVRSGQPVRLQVRDAGPDARVAYALEFARSAYGPSELRTTFSGPLAMPVQAQAFARDGAGLVARGHVWVEPYRPPNCAAAGPAGRREMPFWAAAACLVLVRRRRLGKKAAGRGRLE